MTVGESEVVRGGERKEVSVWKKEGGDGAADSSRHRVEKRQTCDLVCSQTGCKSWAS